MPQTHSNRSVLVLAGDGIGPEIMRQVMRVMEFFDKKRIASFDVMEGLVGGSAYDADGVPLTEATLAKAQASDAVLTIDLEAQTISRPDGGVVHFDIDPFRKHCLLNGLDDIGLTEAKNADIGAYEQKAKLQRPWQFGLTQNEA